MNAGQEVGLLMKAEIYRTLVAIMNSDYDAWIRMTKPEVVKEVMVRTRGLMNPEIVQAILDDL